MSYLPRNTGTRIRALANKTGRSVLHASPPWLAPRLRQAKHQLTNRIEVHRATRGPLLSIIVPMYNVQAYLADCLRSLQAQTYRNLEIVVVDDGSPDGSLAIAEQFARKDSRIRIVRRPNGGLSAARNTGIDAATGVYLTFVDSDDTVLPKTYQLAMSSLLATGSDFAVFSYRRMDSARTWSPARWVLDAHDEPHLHTNLRDYPQAQVNAVACSKVFRREFWDANGLRFPEGVVYEDQPVTTRAYATAASFDFLPQELYMWRQREDRTSISQQVHSVADLQARFDAALTSLDILLDLGQREAHDERVKQLLANDFPQSLVLVGVTDNAFWDCLCNGVRELVARAPADAWDRVSPQFRVLYDLVGHKLHDQAIEFVERGGGNLKNFPTEVADGRVFALLPFHDDPQIAIGRDRLELCPHQLTVQTAIRKLWWPSATTLEVRGWAYIDNIDLAVNPTTITLVLTHRLSGRQVQISTRPEPDSNVSRISKHKWCNYENATFGATIDLSMPELASFDGGESGVENWHADVLVATAGVKGQAPLRGLNGWGSAGAMSARDQPDGLRVRPVVAGTGQLVLRRHRPNVVLDHIEIDRLSVTMRLRAQPGTSLASVVINDRARHLELTAAGGQATDGTYTVSFRLPEAGPGCWGWYVRAISTERVELPVGWDGRLGDSKPTAGPEQFDGVWAARTPAGNLTLAQQQQRCRIRSARLSDDGDTLLLDADLDGIGDLSIALRGRTTSATGTFDQSGRDMTMRFSLSAAGWGPDQRPLAPGRYELEMRLATGRGSIQVIPDIADDLLATLPVDLEHPRLRGRLERAPKGHFSVTITAPLAPDERGARHQRELQAWHASLQVAPREHAVLFRTSFGENTSCNARAVHDELRRRGAALDLYWAVRDFSVPVPPGGIPVVHESREWYELLRSARYVMDNMHQPIYHVKGDHQVVIETFHGYPFKVMGHPHWEKLGFGRERISSFDRRAAEWDYLVSPATYATPLLRRDFRYSGEVLEIGYPRNDILRAPAADGLRAQVRAQLGIRADQQVVLYAPTFRDYLSSDDHHAKMVDFLDLAKVRAAFGDDSVLLLRGHAFNARTAGRVHAVGSSIIDVTTYPEVAHLYLAADAAIVDYSSLRFDFALTGKPMVFHVPDLARYRDESRGWLFDFEPTAPGPMVDTTDEVLDALHALPELARTYRDAYATFRRDYLDLDDGHASARFVDAVFVPRGDAPTDPDRPDRPASSS